MLEKKLELSIPTDSEGFVLLKCPLCGEMFGLMPNDIKDDAVLEIWCPNCGLKAKNYLSDDVIKLAMNMLENIASKIVYDNFKKLGKNNSQDSITFNVEKPHKQKPEDPLIAKIETLEIEHYKCCSKDSKINFSSKFEGSYCPFCGGIQDENK